MKTFRFKFWYQLLGYLITIITLFGIGLVFLVAVAFSIIAVVWFFSRGQQIGDLAVLSQVCGLSVLIAIVALIFGIVFPIVKLRLSYIKMGDSGLEMRIWPFYRLEVGWEELVEIKNVRIARLFTLPFLRFTGGKVRDSLGRGFQGGELDFLPGGELIWLIMYFSGLMRGERLIPVFMFQGWPDGSLAQTIKRRLNVN